VACNQPINYSLLAPGMSIAFKQKILLKLTLSDTVICDATMVTLKPSAPTFGMNIS
jgi:hypothetical protein